MLVHVSNWLGGFLLSLCAYQYLFSLVKVPEFPWRLKHDEGLKVWEEEEME